MQDGVHRLRPQDMTLGTREGIVAAVRKESVAAGHVALVLFLYELDVAQSVALHFRRKDILLSDQNAIGALGLPQSLTHLVKLFVQQIDEVAAVHQLRRAEEGLLLFEAIWLITKHVHSGPPARSLRP